VTTILRFLSRRAALLLAAGVGIGLAFPDLATYAWPLLGPSVWVLLAAATMRMDPGRAQARLARPVPVLAVLIWMLAVTPVLAWGLVTILTPTPGLAVALVLMAGAAPLMSTPALAQMLGLDDTLAMLVMIGATLLVPFTLPVVALEILGFELGIDALAWSVRLTVFVGTAIVAGIALRRLLGAARIAAAKDPLDLGVVILLLIFAVAIMDGVAARLAAETGFVLTLVAVAYMAYVAMLVGGAALGVLVDRTIGATAGFVCANRNVGVILAVLPAGADPDILLYFAVWQLPMYTMPAALAPLFRRVAA
jgi:predicted Na+-dependent transporter